MTAHPLRTRTTLASAALLALLATGACAGGSDDDSGDSAAAPAADTARELERTADGEALGGRPSEKRAEAVQVEAQQQSVINQGTVSLRADDVARARADVRRIVDLHQGSITEEETTTDDDGEIGTSRIVLRVPSADFAQTTQELEEVGDLLASTSGSEDVTTQVIDTEVRIRAQEQSLERVEKLLATAVNLREVIALESQLTRRQADLDSLKSQQAYLKDQTTLSTITVHLQRTPEDEPDDDGDDSGFLGGLSTGWNGLVAGTVVVLTLIGFLLPFVVVVLLVGVPLWLMLRGGRRRPSAPVEPAGP